MKPTTKNLNGGYYAIKGFEFQVDKTILELLESSEDENKEICIEQIQDINSSNYVIQVKYKETQKYSPSKVRKPVIQLLEEFKKNMGLQDQPTYYLYCYFTDKEEGEEQLNTESLNEIMGNQQDDFSKDTKELFLKNFKIFFSPSFQEQYELVISKIKEFFDCSNIDEAIFYYSNIANQIRKIVVENKDSQHRVCTYSKIIKVVQEGRKLIFDSSFKEYKGSEAYCKFVKSKFIKPKQNQENFIFVGKVQVDTSVSLAQMILNFLDKYFKSATYDIKPPIFIIKDESLTSIKESLLSQDVVFTDGYENIMFNIKMFYRAPIINRKTSGKKATDSLSDISFKLRIISANTFNKIEKHDRTPNMIYLFDYYDFDNSKFEQASVLSLDQLTTKEINEILKV